MRWLDGRLRHKAWYRKWRGLPDPIPIQSAEITREALRILAANPLFMESVNREYFPEGGTVNIRRPKRHEEKP